MITERQPPSAAVHD